MQKSKSLPITEARLCFINIFTIPIPFYREGSLFHLDFLPSSPSEHISEAIIRSSLDRNGIYYERDHLIAQEITRKTDDPNRYSCWICDHSIEKWMENAVYAYKSLIKKENKEMKIEKTDTVLSVLKNQRIAIVFLNISLENTNADELIFIQQYYSAHRMNAVSNIYRALTGNEPIKDKIYYSVICEILDVDDEQKVPAKLVTKYPQLFYGILTSDEGWRNVPESCAENRLRNCWSTREYLRVHALGKRVLSFKMHHLDCFAKAQEYELNFKTAIGAERHPMKEGPSVTLAGLDHGPLLVLELASKTYYLLREVHKQFTNFLLIDPALIKLPRMLWLYWGNHNRIYSNIERLISQDGIAELDSLNSTIRTSMHLPEEYERLKAKLNQVEKTFSSKSGMVFSFFAIVLSLFSLMKIFIFK
ncbi:hypothetical protein GTO89_03115 [Heliobacterium gestii]|uniref:Uncharacterized protein n=2 Tax=Heliomicrobium gestii TaxID=2699 RepID=A0A845LBY9_HELGE|nr:hypothetical protein [Heliomicrobium gestii]MBM7865779.1 hypothetical protein [Heliomicrobium gestii]MZP42025.1 hypothetical protein [Heliomicrobium gestii]